MIAFALPFMAAQQLAIPGNSPLLHRIGRHVVSPQNVSRFDWVGSGFAINITGGVSSSVSIDIDVGPSPTRFASYIQPSTEGKKVQVGDFFTVKGRKKYTVATTTQPATLVTIIKTQEPRPEAMQAQSPVVLHSVLVSGAARASPFAVEATPSMKGRRMDVYGDSDSAAFGIDANAKSDACDHNSTNQEDFAHGWYCRRPGGGTPRPRR